LVVWFGCYCFLYFYCYCCCCIMWCDGIVATLWKKGKDSYFCIYHYHVPVCVVISNPMNIYVFFLFFSVGWVEWWWKRPTYFFALRFIFVKWTMIKSFEKKKKWAGTSLELVKTLLKLKSKTIRVFHPLFQLLNNVISQWLIYLRFSKENIHKWQIEYPPTRQSNFIQSFYFLRRVHT